MHPSASVFALLVFLLSVLGCARPVEESVVEPEPQAPTTTSADDASAELRGEVPEAGGQPEGEVKTVESAELKFDDTVGLAYHGGEVFTGKATSHYPNGQLASEVSYYQGQRHGLEASWFEDGARKFEGRFQTNELVGVFEEWYQNGQRKSQEVWQRGKRHSIMEWDENGNLLRTD